MKRSYFLAFAIATCFIAFSAVNSSAQMAGGYGDANKNSTEVKAAAKTAIDKESRRSGHNITLIKIDKAQQQVVAGMNYKVCLKVRDGKKTRWATAVVYQPLRGRRSLSSWDWGKCDW